MTFKKKLVAVEVTKIFVVKKKHRKERRDDWKKHC